MNIRLTPKGLSALKALAGEAGMRPGELVTRWVEERLEAERSGSTGFTGPDTSGSRVPQPGLAARIDELAARIAALEAGRSGSAAAAEPAPRATDTPRDTATSSGAAAVAEDGTPDAEAPAAPKRRGRPPKTASTSGAAQETAAPRPRGRPRTQAAAKGAVERRVPLHQEIIAVISERGPQTAAELAAAITERAVFQPPRSGKPLDAATVNSRVSNPVYRSRFVRDGHRIGLAGA